MVVWNSGFDAKQSNLLASRVAKKYANPSQTKDSTENREQTATLGSA